jgi:DNA-3-methyladenine glycosylase
VVRTSASHAGNRGSSPRGVIHPQSFFARDALIVARDLLGQLLCRDDVVLRITEVEAYRHPGSLPGGDSASHARAGRTARTEPMFGPPGHAYVYVCYGIHSMLNLVTDREGEASAVLIRAAEPVEGLETITARRGGITGPASLTGPGKVGAALGLDRSWSGHALFEPGALVLCEGPRVERILAGPRVGIDYATARDRKALYRLAVPGTPWVSERRSLRPRRT